jgi:hypothetical protein
LSVVASDDVDFTSTTTDPSVSEQDQAVDDKPGASPKIVTPNIPRGVQLLRRQPNPSMTGEGQQSSPTRLEATSLHTSTKETVDPALLEAFANPMNRQYLLQLEASLNNFLSQSR